MNNGVDITGTTSVTPGESGGQLGNAGVFFEVACFEVEHKFANELPKKLTVVAGDLVKLNVGTVRCPILLEDVLVLLTVTKTEASGGMQTQHLQFYDLPINIAFDYLIVTGRERNSHCLAICRVGKDCHASVWDPAKIVSHMQPSSASDAMWEESEPLLKAWMVEVRIALRVRQCC